MRTIVLLWIGANAAWVGFMFTRSVLLERRLKRISRMFLDHEYDEALDEDTFRQIRHDIVMDTPVEVCDMGVFIPLTNPRDVADFISGSPVFTRSAA